MLIFHFVAQLQAGVACASVSGAGWPIQRVCVQRRPLGDGVWHTVAAERHGHNLLVSVDEGDGWRVNETLASLTAHGGLGPPPPLSVDKHDGVTVGGLPEFMGVNLVTVHDDLQDSECSSTTSLPSNNRKNHSYMMRIPFILRLVLS